MKDRSSRTLRPGKQKYAPAVWESAFVAYSAGMTPSKIAENFKIPYGTVLNRMARYNWRSQVDEFQKASKGMTLSEKQERDGDEVKEVGAMILEDWERKGKEHRARLHKITDKLLTQAEEVLPTVETIKDLEVLDAMARRNLGLGNDDKAEKNNFIINLALLQQKIEDS